MGSPAYRPNLLDGHFAWLVPGLLLVLATIIAYSPAVSGDFIWDDDSYVSANPVLRDVDGLRRLWLEPRSIPQYYPVVHTTFWIEYQLYGPWTPGYHTINILLHATGALLLAILLRRQGLPPPAAWMAAAVFALHPVHVESVAWITERKNVLSGACYLAAMIAYCRFAGLDESDPSRSTRPWGAYVLTLAFFVAALLSKSVTATFPAAALLLVYWKRGRIAWRDVWPLLPMLALGIAAGLHTAHLEETHVGAQGSDFDFTAVERLLIAGRAAWFYLGKLLLPVQLTFIYPRWTIDASQPWQYLPPIGAVALLVVLWRNRGRWGRGPLVAVLLFGGTLMPALGFFNVYPMRFSFVADHFQYLASLGIIVAVVAAAHRAWSRRTLNPRLGGAMACSLLVLLAMQTWRQAHVYRDYETVWRDTLDKNPDAWIAHYNLAFHVLDRGDRAGYEHHLREVIRTKPDFAEGYVQLASWLAQQGNMGGAEPLFVRAIEIQPGVARWRYDYGMALRVSGDHARAAMQLEQAIAMAPGMADWRLPLAQSYILLGAPDRALVHLDRAAALGAAGPEWSLSRGSAYLQLERWDEARESFEEVIAAQPGNARARTMLAVTLMRLGQGDAALAQFQAASSLDPSSASGPMNEAAALADLGRFGEAAVVAERALDLARRQGDEQTAAVLESRLATYRAKARP